VSTIKLVLFPESFRFGNAKNLVNMSLNRQKHIDVKKKKIKANDEITTEE